jgi:type IV secretion system protein VirD4
MNLNRLLVIIFGGTLTGALAFLVWTFAYAVIHDVRRFREIRASKIQLSLIEAISDDPLATWKQIRSGWPARGTPLTSWPQYFVVKTSAMAAVPALLGTFLIMSGLSRRRSAIFGDARFLRRSELGKAGLNAKTGLILGRVGGRLLRDADQSHVMVIGPPSFGKTESFVIPNLIAWEGSFIALDFKGVLYDRTAQIRSKRGDTVMLFAPGFEHSHTYNPLALIRTGHARVSDIQTLASLLMPVLDAKEAHWNESAQTLVSGLISYVQESTECEGKRTLGTIVRIFSATPVFNDTMKAMLREPGLSDFTRQRLSEFLNVPGDEAGSIRSTLMRHLKPWQNPVIEALTASDAHAIRIDQLRKERLAIYLVIDTAQLEIFTPVLKLFLEQVNSFVNAGFRQKGENKILFMIDEFYQLGRVRSIISQLPFARDRDIRICLVSQGVAQIDEKFGTAGREAIMASCALQLFCGFNDKVSVDMVSAKAGTRTVTYFTTSHSGSMMSAERRRSKNEHLIQAPLLRPADLYQWDRDKLLVLKASHPPFVMTKVLADKSRRLKRLERAARRIKLVIPALATPTPFSPSWARTIGLKSNDEASPPVGEQAKAVVKEPKRPRSEAAKSSTKTANGDADAGSQPSFTLTREDQMVLDKAQATAMRMASLEKAVEQSPLVEDKVFSTESLRDVQRQGEKFVGMFR